MAKARQKRQLDKLTCKGLKIVLYQRKAGAKGLHMLRDTTLLVRWPLASAPVYVVTCASFDLHFDVDKLRPRPDRNISFTRDARMMA